MCQIVRQWILTRTSQQNNEKGTKRPSTIKRNLTGHQIAIHYCNKNHHRHRRCDDGLKNTKIRKRTENIRTRVGKQRKLLAVKLGAILRQPADRRNLHAAFLLLLFYQTMPLQFSLRPYFFFFYLGGGVVNASYVGLVNQREREREPESLFLCFFFYSHTINGLPFFLGTIMVLL